MLHLLAVVAALSGPAIDLPGLLADELPKVRERTEVAVLLPQRMPDRGFPDYVPDGSGHPRRWTLDIGAVEGCGGSTACFVAHFQGREGGTPVGARQVDLARGRHGRFKPISCGASCSPASVSWRERGATYTIQAKEIGRRGLVRMANSAIRHGPR